jgi:alcohol dehydrogenase
LSSIKLRFGTYAEYFCLPEDWNIALKPVNLNFEEAAAIPYGGLLASHMIKKANVKAEQNVLIYGASGSIGTMAIQLAKNKGAIVTSVCSSKNLEFVKSLGSDKVIDYTRDNSVSLLETYDLVIDAAGKDKSSPLKEKSKISLSSEGKYISIDDSIPSTPKENFIELRQFAEQGKIRPVIDRVYTLEQTAEAHRYVDKRHKRGNVIISIN